MLATLVAHLAAASERSAARPGRETKMPEPLIAESFTDLDGAEPGEVEVDLTGALRPASANRPALWAGSLEAEWRATERLGLALELGFSNVGPEAMSGGSTETSLRAGASWVLLHHFDRDFHLQAEASVQILRESEADVGRLVDPSNSRLPASFGLRGGIRGGAWTIRGGLGGAAGGHSAHAVPLRADLSVFGEFRCGGVCGFAGLEVDADWSWQYPWLLAPTLVFDGARFRVPFRLGVAAPLALWGDRSGGAILLRLIYEPT